MKLIYRETTFEFKLLEQQVTYISVEDKKLFRSMVLDFVTQLDGGEGFWILNDNNESKKIDAYLHMIQNPLHVDVNSKSILTKLQNSLVKDANTYVIELSELQGKLHEFYSELEMAYPMDIYHKLDIGAADIIKLGSFHFDDDRKNHIDSLITYMEVVQQLLHINVFVLLHLDTVLEDDELEEFIRNVLHRKIHLICLSTSSYGNLNIDKSLINGYTVDKDFCLF